MNFTKQDVVPAILESLRQLAFEGDLSVKNVADAASGALDGEVSIALRKCLTLDERRRLGIFPTGSELRRVALDLLEGLWHENSVIADPTCGPGDLLIEAMQRLIIASPELDLRKLSNLMRGGDIVPQLVELTQARLLLQAKVQGLDIQECSSKDFRRIQTADFLQDKGCLQDADIVLLNPPFTKVKIEGQSWASGSVTSAAVFCLDTIRALRPQAHALCILPDVLRSGSRYKKWREEVASLLSIKAVRLFGQFDELADVHVFIMFGQVKSSRTVEQWPSAPLSVSRLSDYFSINVGTVVPHRSPESATPAPYLCAKALLGKKCINADALPQRSFGDKKFKPPFVVVRRTSRPGDAERARATVVTGNEDVLVENHLIVLKPNGGQLSDCEKLILVLSSSSTNNALDEAIRCRHLTTSSLKDLPWGIQS